MSKKFAFGIIEGFFGPTWSKSFRKDLGKFCSENQIQFYIYAPKADQNLRKGWRSAWSSDYLSELRDLAHGFHSSNVKFGVGFSPFELNVNSKVEIALLAEKLKHLSDLKIDILGIFFDDMKYNDESYSAQLKALSIARENFTGEIFYCPTFYSYDPILPKIFGARPEDYFERLGRDVPNDIEILWTGPKVISSEISAEHLEEVGLKLRRKPHIWDNIFANDGPRNCKFLKLRFPQGRSDRIHQLAAGLSNNPSNQENLSLMLSLALKKAVVEEKPPVQSFVEAANELWPNELVNFITENRQLFLDEGLDKITDQKKSDLLVQLSSFEHPVACEISDWLNGKYIVGEECLTD
jgi:hyaluronoglucosaminidase